VDRFGFQTGGLGHAFGGPAGGCTQLDAQLLGGQDLQDGVDQGGLTHPRPACDHQHLAGQCLLHRCFLASGQLQAQALLHPADRLARIDGAPGWCSLRQLLQRFGDAPLIAVQVGQEDRRLGCQGIGHDGALADF
jgi:hypothetical protein